MGMFDTFFCEYKLPNIDLSGTSLTQKDIQYHDYQTKELDNVMEYYTIEEDGRISYVHYNKTEWVEDSSRKFVRGYIKREEPETRYLKDNHTLYLYGYLASEVDPNDYSWEWKVTVIEGQVDTVYLENFKKYPNTERKILDAKWKAQAEAQARFMKTAFYKYFWKWVELVRFSLRRCIVSVLEKLVSVAYKI